VFKRETFRTNYPQEAVAPHGEWLNRVGRALNGGNILESYSNNGTPAPPVFLGIARIIDASNTCATNTNGEYQAPCAQEDRYLCKFRFWDSDLQKWDERDTEMRLDAGAFWYFRNLSDTYGAIPAYVVGDMVPALYDPQRGWCIPLESSPQPLGSVTIRGQLGVEVPKVASAPYQESVIVAVEVFRNGAWRSCLPELTLCGGDMQAATGNSGSMPLTLHLKHNDFIRMTCCTASGTTAVYRIFEHGIRLTHAGRTYNGSATVFTPTHTPYGGARVMGGLQVNASSPLRYKDALTFESYGDFIRVKSYGPDDHWLVHVEFWAEIMQRPESSSSASSASTTSTSSSSSSSSTSSSSSQSGTSSSSSGTSSSTSTSSGDTSSSSSGYETYKVVECVHFFEDPDCCQIYVQYAEFNFPKALGVRVNHDVSVPEDCPPAGMACPE
jgi:uncharacterized membrane protein YgcG